MGWTLGQAPPPGVPWVATLTSATETAPNISRSVARRRRARRSVETRRLAVPWAFFKVSSQRLNRETTFGGFDFEIIIWNMTSCSLNGDCLFIVSFFGLPCANFQGNMNEDKFKLATRNYIAIASYQHPFPERVYHLAREALLSGGCWVLMFHQPVLFEIAIQIWGKKGVKHAQNV